MLAQRRRRWANIATTLDERLVSAGREHGQVTWQQAVNQSQGV